MKTKMAILFATIFIIVGGTMGVVGMSGLNWDFWALDTSVYEERFYELPEGETVLKVKLDSDNWKTEVVKGDKLSFKYYESEKITYTVKVVDGVLIIDNDEDYSFWNWRLFNFKSAKYTCVLTVPDNISLELDVVNLNIDMDGVNFDKIDIDSANLNLNLKNSIVQKIDISGANLDIDMNDCSVESMSVDGANANVYINNCTAKKFDADSANLKVISERLIVDDFNVEGANISGKVNIVGEKAEFTIKSSSINGNPFGNQTGTTDKKITIDSVNFSAKIYFVA